jgi:RNA polymerase sigma-70 factor (ECF subfamily)
LEHNPIMQPDEQLLVAQAQQGDKAAVTGLYEAYAHRIFRYISYRVDSDSVAEDLTAEVFLRMVQGLPRYQITGAPFGAWLYRIAATQVADHYRQQRQVEPISEEQPADDTDPLNTLARQEERARLREALQALPEDYQTLLILRFMQQLPHTEVAEVLNKSEAAIRVMQHRALKALAAQLGQSGKAHSYLRGEEP